MTAAQHPVGVAPLHVWHVITGLNTGGAETSLMRLVAALTDRGVSNVVVSLTDEGPVGRAIAESGTRVEALGMQRGRLSVRALFQLTRLLRDARPDVVQTWMYHANLIGGVAARAAGIRSVAWNVRAARMEHGAERRSTIMLARGLGRMARLLSRRVVLNSAESLRVHARFGYPLDLLTVVPNGFDVELFRPDEGARAAVRADMGVRDDRPLVGTIGRVHPAKDHETFLRAAAHLAAAHPSVDFVIAGDGADESNAELAPLAQVEALRGRVHLLGPRRDVQRVCAALDVFTLTSRYESFPNVLAEAMASGLPCVTTDVGEASVILGDAGRVVPVRDPDAVAAAWHELLALPVDCRRAMGARARERIVGQYSIQSVASRYMNIYQELRRG